MKQYFVYILKCSDNSYYTGVTNDLERRFGEHQSGINADAYTHNRRPVILVFSTEFNDINQAIAFEKQLKGWSRKKKEALINNEWAKLPSLAECKNQTSHKLFDHAHRDQKPQNHQQNVGLSVDDSMQHLKAQNHQQNVGLSGDDSMQKLKAQNHQQNVGLSGDDLMQNHEVKGYQRNVGLSGDDLMQNHEVRGCQRNVGPSGDDLMQNHEVRGYQRNVGLSGVEDPIERNQRKT